MNNGEREPRPRPRGLRRAAVAATAAVALMGTSCSKEPTPPTTTRPTTTSAPAGTRPITIPDPAAGEAFVPGKLAGKAGQLDPGPTGDDICAQNPPKFEAGPGVDPYDRTTWKKAVRFVVTRETFATIPKGSNLALVFATTETRTDDHGKPYTTYVTGGDVVEYDPKAPGSVMQAATPLDQDQCVALARVVDKGSEYGFLGYVSGEFREPEDISGLPKEIKPEV